MKYLYWWFRLFNTKQEIKKFNQILLNNTEEAKDSQAAGVIKSASVKFIKYRNIKKDIKFIEQNALVANAKAFGFSLYPEPIDYVKLLNYNIYSSNNKGEYGWHWDGELNSPSSQKLTILVNLSDSSYKGGEFQLLGLPDLTVPELTPGNMIVFPSLIGHRVLPVTKGIRKSLALWFYGPKFI